MDWDESQYDGLDDVLRAANWPDPQPEHVERLENQWRRVVRRRRIQAVALLSMGVLAPVAGLAVSLAIWRAKATIEPSSAFSVAIEVSRKDEITSSIPRNQFIAPSEAGNEMQSLATENPPLQLVRDPNAFEQALVLMHRQQAIGNQHEYQPVTSPSGPKSTAQIAVAITTDGGAQPEEVDALFSALSNSRVSVRLTAARYLGGLNNPAVSDRLARMALSNVNRREALVALLSSSDPVAQQFLAYAGQNLALAPSLRAIMARGSGSIAAD